MNIALDEIRSKAPDGATHYAYDEEDIIYLNFIPVLGYWNGNYYLDEYEIYLLKPKPL